MPGTPLAAVSAIVPPSSWDPREWELEDSRPEDDFFYVRNKRTGNRVATRRYFNADLPYFQVVFEL